MSMGTLPRFLITESCPHCGKPVYADEGYYSTTGAHWDCHSKAVAELDTAITKANAAFTALTGKRPKRVGAKRGTGGPTKKVAAMIQAALERHFEGAYVSDVQIYLASPVWCQERFDIRKFEGSALVDGKRAIFGSWASVGELLKFRELRVIQDEKDWWRLEIDAAAETRRIRRKSGDDGACATTNSAGRSS